MPQSDWGVCVYLVLHMAFVFWPPIYTPQMVELVLAYLKVL